MATAKQTGRSLTIGVPSSHLPTTRTREGDTKIFKEENPIGDWFEQKQVPLVSMQSVMHLNYRTRTHHPDRQFFEVLKQRAKLNKNIY